MSSNYNVHIEKASKLGASSFTKPASLFSNHEHLCNYLNGNSGHLLSPIYHLKVCYEISDSERDFGTEPIQERSSFSAVYNWWFYLKAKSVDRQVKCWLLYSVGLKSLSVIILIVALSHPLPFWIYHQSKNL